MGFTNGGDFGKGVVGTIDGGSGGGIYVKGSFVFGYALLDEGVEFRGDHATLRINGDGNHVVGSEATHLSSFFQRIVAMGRSEENELMVSISILFGIWEKSIAGNDHGGCV